MEDPVTDSWLPRDEVLNDIQNMLSHRVGASGSGRPSLTEDLRV